VPPGEVAHRIKREQPHEDPSPDAEKVLGHRCRADDRTRGEYQPKSPCKNDRSAGAGDPIPGRQPTVILRRATPVCGRAPRCSSGQRELEEDDAADQAGSGNTNLDLGHKVIVSDRRIEGDPAVRISLVRHAVVKDRVPATCEFVRSRSGDGRIKAVINVTCSANRTVTGLWRHALERTPIAGIGRLAQPPHRDQREPSGQAVGHRGQRLSLWLAAIAGPRASVPSAAAGSLAPLRRVVAGIDGRVTAISVSLSLKPSA
jgi:hypothetical protein